ncbi:MAG: tetraacyldisaccharide 4'-kinase [Myxococcales bacterium]|nr:tetraacyldisaccharide 4'-kinase [Myxococcales bacterium]
MERLGDQARRASQAWLERTQPSGLSRQVGRAVAWAAQHRVVRPQSDGGASPVVVVGGTTLGGAGRTAVVQWLAAAAVAAGARVAVVGHGYRARRFGRVPPGGHADFGDDASLLAVALPGVWVETGPRAAVARRLARSHDLVFTDGGLLDPTVQAGRVIAVCDASSSPLVVPAGPARVRVADLPGTVAVWAHRVDEPTARPVARAEVRSRVVGLGLRDLQGRRRPLAWLQGRAVRPACAIGRPGSFLETLRGLGALPGDPLVRADHGRFRPGECPPDDGRPWVITTKDAARWPPGWPALVLETSLAVEGRLPGLPPWD